MTGCVGFTCGNKRFTRQPCVSEYIGVVGLEVGFCISSIAHKDDRSGDVGPLCLTQGEFQKLRYHLEQLSKTLNSVSGLKLLKVLDFFLLFLKIRHLEEILHPQIIEFIDLIC